MKTTKQAPKDGYILTNWNQEKQYRATAIAYMEREGLKSVKNENGSLYTLQELKSSVIGHNFKTEWAPEDFKVMHKAIAKHFKGKEVRTMHGNFFTSSYKEIDSKFGLAYASTGMYAEEGICNTEVYFDLENVYRYQAFIMHKDGTPCAYLWDKEENEIIIKL